jgi:hypothetical protein
MMIESKPVNMRDTKLWSHLPLEYKVDHNINVHDIRCLSAAGFKLITPDIIKRMMPLQRKEVILKGINHIPDETIAAIPLEDVPIIRPLDISGKVFNAFTYAQIKVLTSAQAGSLHEIMLRDLDPKRKKLTALYLGKHMIHTQIEALLGTRNTAENLAALRRAGEDGILNN